MKLKIEDFFKNLNLSNDINNIISDSINCYKNGIYRPSLLMSYVAFLMILRERIINSDKPHLFEETYWRKYQTLLTYDLKWEQTIYDITQLKEKRDNQKVIIRSSIFSIDESLRNQISYWRDRRNDCAHYKTNKIDAFHIEAFWAFLESNLYKITVEGGKINLLNKFKLHFDSTYTPKDKSYTHLINEISYSVDQNDLQLFWNELFIIVGTQYYEAFLNDDFLIFIENIIKNTKGETQESIFEFLKNKDSLFFKFIDKFPFYINHYNLNELEVRNLWKTKLTANNVTLNIYAILLNNNLIPNSEVEEAHNHIIKNLKEYKINEELLHILVNSKFNNFFEEYYFNESKFKKYMEVNNISDILISYLRINDFTIKSTGIIAMELNKEHYYSEWLEKKIRNLFIEFPNKKNIFENICIKNAINIPNRIN